MSFMATHKRNLRHAAPGARRYPWPLMLIAAPAAVAIWSGWVGLGGMCGFGPVNLLPGIGGGFHVNTAITLPVGVEAYGAYALGAWLTPGTPERAREFARRSAVGALILGMAGQIIYHLLAAAHAVQAPWPVVVLVACLPVATLGFAAALTHLILAGTETTAEKAAVESVIPSDDESVVESGSRGDSADAAVITPSVALVETADVSTAVASVETSEVTTDASTEDTPGFATEVVPVVTPESSPVVAPKPSPKRRRVVPAEATNDQLVDLILEHAEDPAALKTYRVNKILKEQCNGKGVGEARAAKLVELAQRRHREHRVIPIGERRQA